LLNKVVRFGRERNSEGEGEKGDGGERGEGRGGKGVSISKPFH